MSPWAVANLGAVFLEMGQMCKSIPLEAPWEAKNAEKWDQHHAREVVEQQHRRPRPPTTCSRPRSPGCYTSAASEVSMLFVLYQMASGGGPGFVLGTKDASQDSRIVGGMGAVYGPMAAEIGDSLHLSQPVRRIDQDADGVTVRSDDMTVRARPGRSVAVPIAIASQIIYEPMLPRRPVVPASAHAERGDLQDQHRLRRAVLA